MGQTMKISPNVLRIFSLTALMACNMGCGLEFPSLDVELPEGELPDCTAAFRTPVDGEGIEPGATLFVDLAANVNCPDQIAGFPTAKFFLSTGSSIPGRRVNQWKNEAVRRAGRRVTWDITGEVDMPANDAPGTVYQLSVVVSDEDQSFEIRESLQLSIVQPN